MMKKKITLFFLVIGFGCFGCGQSEYQDAKMGMTVQRLDSDLENRWATSGVAVKRVDSRSKANQAGIEVGALISYITGEIPLDLGGSFNRIVAEAMRNDNQVVFKLSDGTEIKLSVRQRGDKPGLKVKGGQISVVKLDSPAEKAGLRVGQTISSVIDERNIKSVQDYKKAIKDFSKYKKTIVFQTTELSGVKMAAVKALSQLTNQSALDQLIEHVEGDKEALRQPAVSALEELVDTVIAQGQVSNLNQEMIENSQISDLAQRYMQRVHEPNPEIRRSCLSILSVLKPTTAISGLISVVQDEVELPGIRFKAGSTLSQIGVEAVESLIVAYENGNIGVKDIAASALGNIANEKSKRMLFRAVVLERNPTVQLTLANAIAKFNDVESKRVLGKLRSSLQENSGLRMFLDELLRTDTRIEAELNSESEFETL